MSTIKVSNNNNDSNCFTSVTEALASLPESDKETIHIQLFPGIYHEKVHICHNNLLLEGMGDSAEDTIITFDDYAFDVLEDGSKRGTFRSYSVLIDANDITVRNLTIANESSDETTDGQAIALYADGNNLHFEHVRLVSRQDTLFTGPLPPKELQPGGFIGPKQFAPRINGIHHYDHCYICGNIDFIFGSATAYFNDCTIESITRSASAGSKLGYVCAPSTPEGQDLGYIFRNCQFISDTCEPDTCYLARPWRNYAKAVFLQCQFGSHIHPDGFHDWNKQDAHSTVVLGTYECTRDNQAYEAGATFATQFNEFSIQIYNSMES